jgi:hypothetical protein
VATLDFAGHVSVWSGDGAPLWHRQLPVAAAYALAWSPDGKQLAVGTSHPRLVVLTLPAAVQ